MGEQGGVSRRDVLKLSGATGGLTAMAGCLGWITGGGESGGDRDDSGDEQEENEGAGNGDRKQENTSDEEADTGGDTEDTNETKTDDGNETGGNGNENESAPENETDNETEEQEKEEQEPLTPDENETEVNESKYEDQDEREITERPESDVEVTAEAEKVGDGLVLNGEVKNVSEEYVDTVDLDISIYDENEAYIGADIVSVGDLEPGDTKAFERTLSATELQGEPSNIQINVTVYGPA